MFRFDNSYVRDLSALGTPVQPARAPAPRLLYLNTALAAELGLDARELQGEAGAQLFSGNQLPAGAQPFAQAYAGHQFGHFNPQLGDGRALLVGELIDTAGRRRDIALKGSGRTVYARGGDGKAAVGPMLREVLIGEAMHALGVPTTRALAVVATGETVQRELPLPGAVLTRVAASHLRVGSFQLQAARGALDALRALTRHALARHDPGLLPVWDDGDHAAAAFGLLAAVAQRQARLIAQWMNLGFIHGVMNTDNMTISGETIDYGPCAFMEAYDPNAVFSSIDHGGRYAYGNQPGIARWNLARLAEGLLPVTADADDAAAVQAAVDRAMQVIDAFPAWYDSAWRAGQRAKLGLATLQPGDDSLADAWLALLQAQQVDFTLAWRLLGGAAAGRPQALRLLFADTAPLDAWLARWAERCAAEDGGAPDAGARRAASMHAVNPRIIPRNHKVEEALTAATMDDALAPFEQLLAALQQPFSDDPSLAAFAEPAPPELTAGYQTFCGT